MIKQSVQTAMVPMRSVVEVGEIAEQKEAISNAMRAEGADKEASVAAADKASKVEVDRAVAVVDRAAKVAEAVCSVCSTSIAMDSYQRRKLMVLSPCLPNWM